MIARVVAVVAAALAIGTDRWGASDGPVPRRCRQGAVFREPRMPRTLFKSES
ncbi:hypothetical protein GCM10010266_50840 [Streptomyces griseomycini]|nr:hypothetical protein GCM10010266_50840 [Streptomyces griseomycini]